MAWESTKTRCSKLLLLLLRAPLSTGAVAVAVEWGGRWPCGCCWCVAAITTRYYFPHCYCSWFCCCCSWMAITFCLWTHTLFSSHTIIGKFTVSTRRLYAASENFQIHSALRCVQRDMYTVWLHWHSGKQRTDLWNSVSQRVSPTSERATRQKQNKYLISARTHTHAHIYIYVNALASSAIDRVDQPEWQWCERISYIQHIALT